MIGSHLMGEVLTDKYGAMVVPRSAVLSDEKGRYVFVNDQGVAKKIYIKIGQSTHDWVEVASGLNIHDRVIYLGNYELEPGMKVREEHSK
jgi:multidrug efflux pump subunit AcrA (membrane-fusion protein)